MPLTRREFLLQSALAAGAVALVGPVALDRGAPSPPAARAPPAAAPEPWIHGQAGECSGARHPRCGPRHG